MQDLKLAFIQQEVTAYFEEVSVAMAQAIEQKNAIKTKQLKNSIRSRIITLGQSSVQGELIFEEYGRFLDMGVNRYNPLGGLGGITQALQGMKPRKIYSPIAFGKLNGLMGSLLYGFTEETIRSLKQELQDVQP